MWMGQFPDRHGARPCARRLSACAAGAAATALRRFPRGWRASRAAPAPIAGTRSFASSRNTGSSCGSISSRHAAACGARPGSPRLQTFGRVPGSTLLGRDRRPGSADRAAAAATSRAPARGSAGGGPRARRALLFGHHGRRMAARRATPGARSDRAGPRGWDCARRPTAIARARAMASPINACSAPDSVLVAICCSAYSNA